MAVVAIVACAAGGLESLADGLVRPLLDLRYDVTVTATPSAHRWLRDWEDDAKLRSLTGYEVRSDPRLPAERSPHPTPDVIVCAPATANTVAKVALGIADNQALTLLCENVATKPLVVFPRINAGHARHPAWAGHLAALETAGVSVVYGPDVWPLFEPREAPPGRAIPWTEILRCVREAIAT
jgi:phosphopantothenoylcysteine synthetase/decarboxylase